MSNPKDTDNQPASKVTHEAVSSLESAVSTFSHRLKRKIREQEEHEDTNLRHTEQRHDRILQAMTMIRRALNEACKIELGRRFYLELEINDWEGWPRLELNLLDRQRPEVLEHGLVVTASDRLDHGLVLIALRSGNPLARFKLANPEEFARIPTGLKRAVQTFLDSITDYLLNPNKSNGDIRPAVNLTNVDQNAAPHLSPESQALEAADLFEEHSHRENDNQVEVDPNVDNPLDKLSLEAFKK